MATTKSISGILDALLDYVMEKRWVFYLVLSGWVLYYLYALLGTSFISDDAYNSQIRGTLIQNGISIFDRTMDEILGWMKGAGRFYPLAFYVYILYYFTHSLIVIKSITLMIIVADVLLFSVLVKNISGSIRFGLLVGLVVPVFFQFRLWHDPILGFTFLLPLLFLYVIVSLVLYQKYLKGGKKIYLVFSSMCYLLALLTYEVSYPLCIVFFVMAYTSRLDIKQAIIKSMPYLILSTLFVGFFLLLKTEFSPFYTGDIAHKPSYEGAQLYLNYIDVIKTFVIQTSAAMPLSYYIGTKNLLKNVFIWSDLLLLPAFFVVCFKIINKTIVKQNVNNFLVLILIGVTLLFIPSLVISVSGHQKEIMASGFGYGYLPVYIQYFGLCLILLLLIFMVSSKLQNKKVIFSLFVSGLLTITAALNLGQNRAVANDTNSFYKYPRQLLESALKAGIVDDVSDNALILRRMRFPSDYTWFFTTVTDRVFDVCEIVEPEILNECIIKHAKSNGSSVSIIKNEMIGSENINMQAVEAWVLAYTYDGKKGEDGRLYLGRIDNIKRDLGTKKPLQIVVNRLRVFELKNNILYEADLSNHKVDFLKIMEEENEPVSSIQKFNIENYVAEGYVLQWGEGFHNKEGTKTSNLRWSLAKSELIFFNYQNINKDVSLSMRLSTVNPETANIVISYPDHQDKLVINSGPTLYTKNISIPPGKMTVYFESDATVAANGDPRRMVFGVFNFKIE